MKNRLILLCLLLFTSFFIACDKEEKTPKEETYSHLIWASEKVEGNFSWATNRRIVSQDYVIELESRLDLFGSGESWVIFHKFDKATGAYLGESEKLDAHFGTQLSYAYTVYDNYLAFNQSDRFAVLNLDNFEIVAHSNSLPGALTIEGSRGFGTSAEGVFIYDFSILGGSVIPMPVCSPGVSNVTAISNVWRNANNEEMLLFSCYLPQSGIHSFNLTTGEVALTSLSFVGFVENGRAYGNHQGVFYCTDLSSGNVLWEKTAGQLLGLPDDLLLFTNTENELFALDKMTGQEMWRISESGAIHSIAAWNGSVYYSVSTYLAGHRLSDGSEVLKINAINESFGQHLAINASTGRAFLAGYKRVLCFQL